MTWMEWITPRHSLFTHLPVAVALLLPWALIAAQRPGRGIRPWWTTCRYLSWAGVLGGILAAVIGILNAHAMGLLPQGAYLASKGTGLTQMFRQHQLYALASLALGVLCLRSVFRKRQDYQGIGVLSLFLGLLWSAASLMAIYRGDLLAWAAVPAAPKIEKPAIPPPPPERVPVPSNAPQEANAPVRALDYLSLEPMHVEPVKSLAHGNRWIRVWASPDAAQAYRQGSPLPVGALVVMSTLENRWNRPGTQAGPLYALEIKPDGKPSLTFYWPRVPEALRNETRGADRAYWRGDAPELQACLACHAAGMAPVKDRSRWVATSPMKVKTSVPTAE
jgi:hypothetical protein